MTNKLLKLRPPQIAAASLFVSFVFHAVMPRSFGLPEEFRWTGHLIWGAGFALMLWAWGLFRKHQTPTQPSKTPSALVIQGPYRVTRNPMYTGVVLILLGIAVAVGTWPMFIAPVLFFILINFIFIPFEEKKMTDLFGEKYQEYLKKVPKWI